MDPAENLAVMIMREASEKTATSAGDGTTTSMVLAQAIIHSAMGIIDEKDNLTHVLREIQDACNKVMTELDSMSTVITDKELEAVATISANGDKETGAIIADAYSKVGLTGVVSVEPSSDAVTRWLQQGVGIAGGHWRRRFAPAGAWAVAQEQP
jgi:chaperonin GroEL